MKFKYYPIALIPICLATFVLRALELILAIDPNTGYFASDSVFPTVFNVFLVAAVLFFGSVLFAKKETKPVVSRLYRGSMTDTALGIGAATLMVASALFRFFSEVSKGHVTVSLSLLKATPFWHLVFAVVAAVFLIFFITYPKMTAKQTTWKVLSLAPVALYAFLLIDYFRDFDTVFSHAYGIYLIIFCGLAACALITFSKIIVKLPGRKPFVFFTCTMAMFLSLRIADGVLSLIPSNPYGISTNLFSLLTDLLLTGLMICQMLKVIKPRKRRPAPEATEALPEEQAEEPQA